jgi:hypothetical protein
VKGILKYLEGIFRKFGFKVGFWFFRRFGLGRFKYKPLRVYIESVLDPIQDVSEALVDKDPNDIEQIKEILCRDNELLLDSTFTLIQAILRDNIADGDVYNQTVEILEAAKNKAKESIKC